MIKRVLDVGQCSPDHSAIRGLLKKHFSVEVVQAHHWSDTQRELSAGHFDLVLINRKLDVDYSEGMDILLKIKRDSRFADIPVMLVTNYPEYQERAIAAGGALGFGKAQLEEAETVQRLARILS